MRILHQKPRHFLHSKYNNSVNSRNEDSQKNKRQELLKRNLKDRKREDTVSHWMNQIVTVMEIN